jgi:hypothetical protein
MSRRLALVALAAAAVDAGAIVVFWKVYAARRAVVAQVSDGANVYRHRVWDLFDVEAKTLQIAGSALLLLALVAALAGFAWARRAHRGALAALAVVSPAVMLGLAGLGILGAARAFLRHNDPCGDPSHIEAYRYELLSAHAAPYQAARLAILAVALLSTCAVLALARRPRAPSASRLPAPAALFVLGLGAFAFTRAEAADARSPMPLLPWSDRLSLPPEQAVTLPPAQGCELGLDAPLIALDASGWLADGVLVSDEADLVRVLTSKRQLWQQVQPNKPFPGIVDIAIPADTPLEVVRPMLEAARAAGFPILEVIEALPTRRWSSRTLGAVPYAPRGCQVRLAAGQEIPRVGTWGAMASALARGP